MTLDIPQDVALRLEELAQRQNANIDDLLREIVERYDHERDTVAGKSDRGRYATWGDLLQSAREGGLATPEPVDTADRSREILNTEYTDYLVRRRLGHDDSNR